MIFAKNFAVRLLIPALTFCLFCPAGQAQYVSGRVTGQDGQPIAGGSVISCHSRIAVEESTLTDHAGTYRLKIEFPGQVRIVATRIGYRLEQRDGVQVSEGSNVTLDFVLKAETDERSVIEQLPYSSFVNLLPDGWMKRDYILQSWNYGFRAAVLQQVSAQELKDRFSLGLLQKTRLGMVQESYIRPGAAAEWAAQYIPRGQTLKKLRLPAQSTPDAAGVHITEFLVPADSHDLYVAPDGIVWANQETGGLYRLNPKTGEGRLVPFPWSNRNVLAAKDGSHLWINTDQGKIAQFDPRTEKVGKVYDLAQQFGDFFPHTVKTDANGNLWVTDYKAEYPGRGVRIEVATGNVTLIRFPALELPFDRKASEGYGLAICPDGQVWTSLLAAGSFVEINRSTLEARARELPEIYGGPRRLDCGGDGAVWIPAYAAGVLFRFDPKTEEFRKFFLPTPDSGPYTVKVHPRTGQVWLVTSMANQVYRINPQSGSVSVYQLPNSLMANPLARSRDIQFSGDREVWFTSKQYRRTSQQPHMRLVRLRF